MDTTTSAVALYEVYSYVSQNGTNIHIDAVRLRRWCLQAKPEISLLAIDPSYVDDMIRDNAISLDRIIELEKLDYSEPIIMARFDHSTRLALGSTDDGMHIDGHHRYYLAAKRG